MRRMALAMVLGGASICLGHAQGGRGAGDFSTVGSDAQRTSWIRNDAKISPASMNRPGFELVWKIKLNNQARQLNGLTTAALLTNYIGYRGFRSLALVGGSSDQVFAMDTDLARVEWQKSLLSSAAPAGASLSCPGGMTANVARPVFAAFPALPVAGRGGGGRGNPAKTSVGEPNQGAPILTEPPPAARGGAPLIPPSVLPVVAPPIVPVTPAVAAGRGVAPPGGRGRQPNYLHAVSSDGLFHSMYVSNGEEPSPAIPFLPPNASGEGLIVADNVAYAITTNGCGGAPNAIWALDVTTQQVTSWQPASGEIAGSVGPAFASDGTVFVTTRSGDLVALESKTLKPKDAFKSGQEFTSSPVVFPAGNKTLIAAATRDGRIYVIEAAAMGAPGYKSDVLVPGGNFTPGALTTWQDASGTRYLLAVAGKAVTSWKLNTEGDSLSLEKAWASPEMVAPLQPLVVNGVVFAVSSGEFLTDDAKITAAQRAQRSVPAVLYALDATTGKSLWNSGKTITSFVHHGGVSAGGSQVYLGAHDGTMYAFGFPIEH